MKIWFGIFLNIKKYYDYFVVIFDYFSFILEIVFKFKFIDQFMCVGHFTRNTITL